MWRTYPDANVLLTAWNGSPDLSARAKALLLDENRVFLATSLHSLELLPHASYNGRQDEVAFFRSYLESLAVATTEVDETLVRAALEIGQRTGASGIDALHLAASIRLGADQFVTLEKPTKPMYREKRVQVIHLRDI